MRKRLMSLLLATILGSVLIIGYLQPVPPEASLTALVTPLTHGDGS